MDVFSERLTVSIEDFRETVSKPIFSGVVWSTVVSQTRRDIIGIEYSIDIEGDEPHLAPAPNNECGRLFPVWRRVVWFGATDSHHAGGAAFQCTAREQGDVAEQFAALLRTESDRLSPGAVRW
jgi:hypothetical protein